MKDIDVKYLVLPTVLVFLTAMTPAFADGDIEKGAEVFKKCGACHKIGDGAKNGIGPVLNGVFGRKAGSFEKFKYGKAMKAAGAAGLVWDETLIAEYITNPKTFLRTYLKNRKAKALMNFKLKKADDRKNVVAYLKTFSKP